MRGQSALPVHKEEKRAVPPETQRGNTWSEGTRTSLLLRIWGTWVTKQNGTESAGDKLQKRGIPEGRITFPGK